MGYAVAEDLCGTLLQSLIFAGCDCQGNHNDCRFTLFPIPASTHLVPVWEDCEPEATLLGISISYPEFKSSWLFHNPAEALFSLICKITLPPGPQFESATDHVSHSQHTL